MSNDDRRPRISRTSSLAPRGEYQRPSSRFAQPSILGEFQPPTKRAVEAAKREAGKQVDRKKSAANFYSRYGEDPPRQRSLQSAIERDSTTNIDADPSQVESVASVLSSVNPGSQFLFDRGMPIDPLSGDRSPVLQSRGVFGSADSMERKLPAGQDVRSGKNENLMTISAGVLWLRNLASRDPAAYNKLVVLLRNANYGSLPDDDQALPLNGYTNQVGAAFALAANDLAQAGQGGDGRTLLEYLTQRGQGYADLLAQKEADKLAEEAYVPVERNYQDPATLRSAAKEAAREALGRKLTDEEEARFEAAFRARENAFYDALDTAREGETKFAAYAPDARGQVDEFIDGDEFATERAATRVSEYSQVFMQMMGVG